MTEPIAIIGSSCRLPGGANSTSKLWDILAEPRDYLRKIDRFNVDGFYHKDGLHHGHTNVKYAYLLDDDIRAFDPQFFGIRPVEAESIDPLQRFLLEVTYEAIENAGLPLEDLSGSDTGFFAGVMQSDYADILLRDLETLPQYFSTASSRSILANRISYVFNWHGPSFVIDTACSSSAVALNSAVQSLRQGECKIAVASGANLILGPEMFIGLSKMSLLCVNGRSAMWDKSGNGYGRGEGVVSIVLKRLSDALRDGDHIDCVIREIGHNQDGRTRGITMPSAAAQTALIQRTYANAGLNPQDPRDQPQFFEAHGTGTKAGDPQEAEAIYNAFFGQRDMVAGDSSTQDVPLWVGGIKTVVGHTEATAGLSGLLKAMLAMQAGIIPPNLLFNHLNPEIERFYGPLQIPTGATSWPTPPEGVPRRASVNSFGFGGANVHVILEAHLNQLWQPILNSSAFLVPFLFSAKSESSLINYLSSFKNYLQSRPDINLLDLSWTLSKRRSALAVKTFFTATSSKQLAEKISQHLEKLNADKSLKLGIRSSERGHKILGVFTGQGAQWARMSVDLLQNIPAARKIVSELNSALQSLPAAMRPAWDLLEELSRSAETSNMHNAKFSQTLCTVVQIVLVDLLRVAGLSFSAVIGHSSGEIGAAYAAGFLSAIDAIKVAYLRGFFATRSQGSRGEKGAMLAAGMSYEEAADLCASPSLDGRLKVAAINSSSSVTLSGDDEAIGEAKEILDRRKVFARRLKVDTAYHSHHMQPCAGPYVQAMKDVGITVQKPSNQTTWYSSVLEGQQMTSSDALCAGYWEDNMVNTVRFFDAATSAIANGGPYQLALEIGPHPALKGPATQTFSELEAEIPYFGTLKRGENDVSSFSDAVGAIWAHLGTPTVDLGALYNLSHPESPPLMLKGLPSYEWDHDKPYWHESRHARMIRKRSLPGHPLLGVREDEDNKLDYRWRNFLTIRDNPWLVWHKIQDEMLFPASGYVSMILEAAQLISEGQAIHLIEIEDFDIDRAINISDENSSVETVTNVSVVTNRNQSTTLMADLTISAHLAKDQMGLTKAAQARIKVFFGTDESAQVLPLRSPKPAHLVEVDLEGFYAGLESVGYGYTEGFRTLLSMERRLDFATGDLDNSRVRLEDAFLVHPTVLEQSFQMLLGAGFAPGDGKLWNVYLPKSAKKISVDPILCERQFTVLQTHPIAFDAWLTTNSSHEVCGDVVFSEQSSGEGQAFIRIEGASMQTLNQATAEDDVLMFTQSVWDVAAPSGDLCVIEPARPEEVELARAVERIGHYYWRQLEETISPSEWESSQEHHQRLRSAIKFNFSRDPSTSFIDPEWRKDDEEVIQRLVDEYGPSSVDVRLAYSVGRALPSVIRGETTMIEHMRVDDMLDDFYVQGLGFSKTNQALARMAKQLTHRYPKMSWLEIGAGTGGATSAIFESIGSKFSAYTYTDISSGFFEKAGERFSKQSRKMKFKTLDIERSPDDQGYNELYDVVIASNVLHATRDLQNTLKNTRSLLKPGGYLLLLEITDNTTIRFSFLMGGLSGWWLGAHDNRIYSPCITPLKWNQALRKAGFAGVDAVSTSKDLQPNPMSIIAAQAVDQRVEMLRRPLFKALETGDDVYVLGGTSLATSTLIDEVLTRIGHRFGEVIHLDTIEDALHTEFSPDATVVSFVDLDGPVWKHMTDDRFKALQHIFANTHNLLWISHGQEQNPWTNASAGFLRSLAAELPTLRLQILDFDKSENPQQHPDAVCEVFLRFIGTDGWDQQSDFSESFLWTTEPELRFKAGNLLVKRVKWNDINNARFNACRRKVERSVDDNTPLNLAHVNGSWVLCDDYVPRSLPSDKNSGLVDVEVKHSSLWPLLLSPANVPAHIIVGQTESKDWVAAVTFERSSRVKVARDRCLAIQTPVDMLPTFLTLLLAEIVKDRIDSFIRSRTGSVLLYEPDPLLVEIIDFVADEEHVRIQYLTGDARKAGGRWIYVHPRDSHRAIYQVLPRDALLFIHFEHDSHMGAVERIRACLPPSTEVLSQNMFSDRISNLDDGRLTDTDSIELTLPVERVEERLRSIMSRPALGRFALHSLTLAEASNAAEDSSLFTIFDWTDPSYLPIQAGLVQPKKIFKKDRTYILLGMTGETGRSVARWMVNCGAGAIVLASRNPKIEQAWIDDLESTGARIKVASLDTTSKFAWETFVADIKQDLPPVAGIMNGAMVLQDTYFHNMELQDFEKATAAKIHGTIYMDEFFQDTQLDFFIVFSSFSSQIGSRGQTNYNAANAFMASLIQQRRARGLAASTLHLGSLMGIGLLTRDVDVRHLVMDKFGYTPISESDLHHIIMQVIMAGLPHSTENSEVITGIRELVEGEERGLHWATNPVFSHLVVPQQQQVNDEGEKKTIVAAREQLATAKTKKEAIEILANCFGTKLSNMLQIPEASFRNDAALVGLGVDSLVAIDIRSWFIKEVSINVSVLKILGGMSTTTLAEYAIEQLPENMLPGLDSNSSTVSVNEFKPEVDKLPELQTKSVSRDAMKPASEQNDAAKASSDSEYRMRVESLTLSPISSTIESRNSTTGTNSESAPSSPATEEINELEHQSCMKSILNWTPISPAQSRFWFLDMFLEDPTSSNITVSFEIQGRVKVQNLSQAVITAAQAHEVLRSCFIADTESPEKAWMGLMGRSRTDFRHKDVSSDTEIQEAYDNVRSTRYNLKEGKTMQVCLLSKSATSHIIIFGYHHIVLDGMGFEAYKADLEQAYSGKLPMLKSDGYFSAAQKQSAALSDGSLKDQFAYWKREFETMPDPLPLLPFSKANSRVDLTKYSTSYVERRLDIALTKKIKSVCMSLQVTPSQFYLAVFRALLMHLTDNESICLGIADANRHDEGVASTVGLFLNMLPLHFRQSADVSFDQLVRETRTKIFEGLEHAGVPFDELLKALDVPRSSSFSPMFQCFYDYHSGTQEKFNFSNQTWTISNRHPGDRAYDLTLDIIEGGRGTLISFIGQDYLYDQSALQKILNCFLILLSQLMDSPSRTIRQASIYVPEEISTAVEFGKGSDVALEWPATLGHRVQHMCYQDPEAIALRYDHGQSQLPYRELESMAQAVRHSLSKANIQPGDRVVVFQEPGINWICSVIGIFYAGAVYVPMVAQNPEKRLRAILKEAEPKAILVGPQTHELAKTLLSGAAIIDISSLSRTTQASPEPIDADPESTAVILFTSGSTGVPKGIKLRHRNLVNHIEGYVKTWNIGKEVVLQQSAYSFDLSIGQIFTALAMGGTLVVAPQEKRGDPVALARLMLDEGVTWSLLTPSEYTSLVQFGAADLRKAALWKHALACGETLTPDLVRSFAKLGHDHVRLYNCYGPAEAIISATMAEIKYKDFHQGDLVPIGRPNANYSIYILDKYDKVVPPGFSGEILIGGCGVGIGYLNLPELTQEKFIQREFCSKFDISRGWDTIYRTGDIGRFNDDGDLLYEGRCAGDTQVKIRGFRIDLQDIESTIIDFSKGVITEAIATVRENTEMIVVHVIFARSPESDDTASYLTKLLADLPLPNYMKPARAVQVDNLPRNLHGKTDRGAVKKLPLPRESAESRSVNEDSPIQMQLAHVWRETLSLGLEDDPAISAKTDFFTIGGNSLLLVKVQALIRSTFDVSIRLLDLLNVSTLGQMASLIESSRIIKQIEWEKEVELDGDISQMSSEPQQGVIPKLKNMIVLLTGATGFFGQFLLRELIQDPTISTIHCLAVRAESLDEAKNRVPLSTNAKVVLHVGDLSAPRLGLSKETFNQLSSEADLIVHSGAKRSFWDNYQELRATNVESTKELIRLAARRRVPVQFLSTRGVLLLDDSIDQTCESSVASFHPRTDGFEGYVASKWACEVLLEKAAAAAGIPVRIHRFTEQQGHGSDEAKQAALEDILIPCRAVNQLPERSTWAGRFDCLEGVPLAREIIKSKPGPGSNFNHHPGQFYLTPSELFDFLEAHLGDEIKEHVNFLPWVGAIKRQGYNWVFTAHDLTLAKTEDGVVTTLHERR